MILYNSLGQTKQEFVPHTPGKVNMYTCGPTVYHYAHIGNLRTYSMEDVLEIVALGRAARNGSNIKNRQPLQKLYIATDRKVNLSEGLLNIAKDELNIKEFEILHDASRFVSYKLKPQLKTLGPKYGKALGAIRNFLDTCNAAEVVSTVKAGKVYAVDLGETHVELSLDDLLISSEPAEGFVSESSDGLTVVLDVHLTEELKLEGAVRELVSRIQNMRKEAGFEVTDRIILGFRAEGISGKVLREKADEIKSDVLAEAITETPDGFVKDFDINGESVTLGVKKV